MAGPTDQKLQTLVDMALRDPDGNEGRNAAIKACRLMKESASSPKQPDVALALQAMRSLFETQRVFMELRLDEARQETARAWAAWRQTRLFFGVLVFLVASAAAAFTIKLAWHNPWAIATITCVYVVGGHYLLMAIRTTRPTS